MTTHAHRATTTSPSPPSTPRVILVPTRASRAVLDGGWWPRSTDPIAELPGLVLLLSERYGPVRQMMLNRGFWDSSPRRLTVGSRVIRIGWFASVDPALAIATTERGDQLDLLVVPPGTAEAAARRAMTRAADPTDTVRAPDLLADPGAQRDDEGGHQADDAPHRTVERHPAPVPG